MKNKKLEEICNSINYDMFKKIGIAEVSIYGLSIATNILEANTQLQLMTLPITAIGNISAILFCLQKIFSLESYSKEITEIKNIQDDIIKNFALLIKEFDFKDPAQVYASYTYALYNGYLSYDKNFNYSKNNIIDDSKILSANISSGVGVCRHITPFLDKVLRQLQYDAYIFSTCCREAEVQCNISMPDENVQLGSMEHLLINVFNHTIDPEALKILESTLKIMGLKDYNINYNYKYKRGHSIFDYFHGNHVLNYVIYNNQSYFLDPTNTSTYSVTSDKKRLVDDRGYEIRIKRTDFNYENSKDFKRAFKNIPDSIDARELKTLISTAKDVCDKNQDIFEQFYLKNSENYEHITSLIRKLKK